MAVLQSIHENVVLSEGNNASLDLIYEYIPNVSKIAESIDTRIENTSTLIKVHKTYSVVVAVTACVFIVIIAIWLYGQLCSKTKKE